MTVRVCPCCKQEKPREEFGNSRNTEDGVSLQCKACMRENSRKARERDPELGRRSSAKNYAKNREKYKELRDASPDVQAAESVYHPYTPLDKSLNPFQSGCIGFP